MMKRMLAMLLAVVLVVSALPVGALAEGSGTPAAQAEHVHKVCNSSDLCADCTHTDVTYEPWDSDTTLPTSGNYYLTKDVTLSAQTRVSGTLNLCLNGHTVSIKEGVSTRHFWVLNNATLRLSNCSDEGMLTGGKASSIMCEYDKTVTIEVYNVLFKGNTYTGTNGGGVVMLQGKNSTLKMVGCRMIENSAGGAGGVLRIHRAGCNVTLIGCEIKNNTAKTISAIRVDNASTVTLIDTIMEGNKTTETGDASYGAVYLYNAGANLVLEGKTQITGNLDGADKAADLFLQMNDDSTMPMFSVSTKGLDKDARIGILLGDSRLTADGGLTVSKALSVATAAASNFVAENENYKAKIENDTVVMAKDAGHIHKVCNGDSACASCAHTDVTYLPWGEGEGEATKLPTSGNYYLTKDVTLSAQTDLSGTSLNLCLNGHTVKAADGKSIRHFMLANNAVLTISNCSTTEGILTGGKSSSIMTNSNAQNASVIELYNITLKGNSYTGGGAVMLQGKSDLKAVSCKFNENTGTSQAGAMRLYGTGNTTLVNCEIKGNTAPWISAIRLENGTLTLIDTVIENNTATYAGDASYGAVYMTNSNTRTLTVAGATRITGNTDADGKAYNVFFQNSVGKQGVLTIGEAGLSGNALIGITLQAARLGAADGMTVTAKLGGKNPVAYLASDNEVYMPILKDDTVVLGSVEANTHKHKICADDTCADHADVIFTAWESDNSLPTTGSYYLTKDVTLSAQVKPTDTLNLCLNGHKVTVAAGSGARHFYMEYAHNLNLTNCDANNEAILTGGQASSIMTSNDVNGKKIHTGEVNLYNVVFEGNTYSNGAALAPQGDTKLTAVGVKIRNNTATTSAGAMRIYSSGAPNGVKATFIDCEITGNTAPKYSAIRQDYGHVTLINTIIEGNHATTAGDDSYGAVYFPNNDKKSLTVSGTTRITGNTEGDGKPANVVFQNAEGKQAVLTIGEAGLSGNALIGITMRGDRIGAADGSAFTVKLNGTDLTSFFTSDKSDYAVAFKDDAMHLIQPATHVHKLCNDASCTDHGDVEFYDWTDATKLPTSGNYCLMTDVQLGSVVTINSELNLCLNGHTVTAKNNERHFVVDGTLTITDCQGSGQITGGKRTFGGAAASVNAGGILNLYSGNLTNNQAVVNADGKAYGGAIFLYAASGEKAAAVFNMYGGKITGNASEKEGGAIFARAGATINIQGGEISGNTAATQGGAIYAEGATLTAKNCIISGNTATSGGAIRLANNATAELTNCQIKDNTVSNLASAIRMEGTSATLKLVDTVIEGNKNTEKTGMDTYGAVFAPNNAYSIILEGATRITNNTDKNGDPANTYFQHSSGKQAVITVSDKGLSGNAKIGIALWTTRLAAGDNMVSANAVAEGQEAYFYSDVTGYTVSRGEDGKLYLVDGHGSHSLCCEAGCTDHANVIWLPWNDPERMPASGNYYLNTDVQLKAVRVLNTKDLNLCLNGHTITAAANERIFAVNPGITLSVTDCTGSGKLTGGVRNFGGVINVNQGATFNLYGGNLTGNQTVAMDNDNGKAGAIYLTKAQDDLPGGVFNMYGGSVSGNKSYTGGAIFVCTGATANIYGGAIANNEAYRGGAIYADAEATVNIAGGKLNGNTTTNRAGAIFLSNAKLNISGGEISGNTANGAGGAIVANKAAVITMTGGKISGSKGTSGGAIIMENKGTTMKLSGGEISGNTGSAGGAIFVSTDTVFEMTGGVISGNTSTSTGGGLHLLRANVTLAGGEIKNNEAATNGGGLEIEGGAVILSGTKITGNRAANGAGIYIAGAKSGDNVYQPAVTLAGGEITGNTASGLGGGVITKDASFEKLELSGDLVITDNKAGEKISNLYLPGEAVFTVGTMGKNAKIGISAQRVYGAMSAKTDVDCTAAFTSDLSTLKVVYKDKTVYLEPVDGHAHCLCNDKSSFCKTHGTTVFAPWSDPGKLPSTPGNYYLTTDVQLGAVCVVNNDISICLNGHTITPKKNERTFAVSEGCTLSVTDCTETGKITGGVRNFGGVINVNQGATFNLYGGNLTGNTTVAMTNENGKAGAVYVTKATLGYKVGNEVLTEKPEKGVEYEEVVLTPGGEFNMYGGSISGNKAFMGGAVYVCDRATMNLYGGTIADNATIGRGGAVVGDGKAAVNIHGGVISGNTASKGAGIYVRNGAHIEMTGGTITKNKTNATFVDDKQIEKASGAAAISLTNQSTMTMSGGEISYNEGAGAGGAVLVESKDTKFVMKGGKFIGNTSTSDGGAIYASTNTIFEMQGGEIKNNQSKKNGGGIYFLRSTGTISGGSITNNTTTEGAGGGMAMARATVTLKGGSVSYNQCLTEKSAKGGGIMMNGATLNIYGGSIVGNSVGEKGTGGAAICTSTASETKNGVKTTFYSEINMHGGTIAEHQGNYGGAMLLQSKTVMNMSGGTIRDNYAPKEGGAVCLYSQSQFHMQGGTMTGNKADSRGGCVKFNAGTSGSFTGGTLTGNYAGEYGAVLNAHGIDTKVVIKNMKIYGNECRNYGGGIAITWNAILDMDDCEFYENKAGEGGAMYLAHKTTCHLDNVKVYNNFSKDAGGAFYLDVGNNIVMTNVEIINNEATNNGGGVYTRANVRFVNCLIDGNVSGKDGGGIATSAAWTYGNNPENTAGYIGRGQGMIIENTVISNNTCVGRGGAVFMAKKNWNTVINSTFTGNVCGESGSALFVGDDLLVNGMTVTGNTSKTDGYAVYYRENSYDGQSYMQAIHEMGGNVIVKDNVGGDMMLCEKVIIGNILDGYGEDTYFNVSLSDGLLTKRLFGEYNYEGGNLEYTVTYGSRSYTEPEKAAAVEDETQPNETTNTTEPAAEAGEDNTMLYAGIGGIAAVIVLAAVVLVIVKKKKAGNTTGGSNK